MHRQKTETRTDIDLTDRAVVVTQVAQCASSLIKMLTSEGLEFELAVCLTTQALEPLADIVLGKPGSDQFLVAHSDAASLDFARCADKGAADLIAADLDRSGGKFLIMDLGEVARLTLQATYGGAKNATSNSVH